MNNLENQTKIIKEDEIDLMALIRVIWLYRRKFWITMTIFLSLSFIFIGYKFKNIYQASAVMEIGKIEKLKDAYPVFEIIETPNEIILDWKSYLLENLREEENTIMVKTKGEKQLKIISKSFNREKAIERIQEFTNYLIQKHTLIFDRLKGFKNFKLDQLEQKLQLFPEELLKSFIDNSGEYQFVRRKFIYEKTKLLGLINVQNRFFSIELMSYIVVLTLISFVLSLIFILFFRFVESFKKEI